MNRWEKIEEKKEELREAQAEVDYVFWTIIREIKSQLNFPRDVKIKIDLDTDFTSVKFWFYKELDGWHRDEYRYKPCKINLEELLRIMEVLKTKKISMPEVQKNYTYIEASMCGFMEEEYNEKNCR